MKFSKRIHQISCIAVAICALASANAADSLVQGFNNPPDSAKPQTWWHWMNGNITKEGIKADLEAMKEIGLGGATIVNADCGIPRGDVPFMSDEWRECFKYAVEQADRLGLKLAVENCAGWSSSGGPWNTPENGMQRITASETQVTGPVRFDKVLAQPKTNLKLYKDIAVLAYQAKPFLSNEETNLSKTPGKLEIVQALFRSKSTDAGGDVTAKVKEMINAGAKEIAATTGNFGDPIFGELKELVLKFKLDGKDGVLITDENTTLIVPTSEYQWALARAVIKTSVDSTFMSPPPSSINSGQVIPLDSIIDISDKLSADGHLKWDVPAGNWTILRLGYTPIGRNNHPAPIEGTGLECDKLSKEALDAHWEGFMAKVLADIGPLAGKALDTSLIDSYEVGQQDWTAKFREEFQKRRGYDPVKYLPTYMRMVVENQDVTERFLWDMRRTISDLFSDNYFAHFDELCRRNGLLSAVEPYTGPFESIQAGSTSDVVMGEFWCGSQGHPSVKLAASIAHIYGKTIVGAESFTASDNAGKWQNYPYKIKALGDLMFAQGLNRYIFHRYAMQPWNDRYPGMTMGPWGFHFERTSTWWEPGKAWIDYISRCEYMLQQGRCVADIAYFTGESAPVEMRNGNVKLHPGYDYDAVSPDVILNGSYVKNGRLYLASGANYGVLVLPGGDINMTPPMIERIGKLVQQGATILGPRPKHSPSLTGYPECDQQVKKWADKLWGDCNGKNVFENKFGKGHVFQGIPLTHILSLQNLRPDFEFQGSSAQSSLVYTHRTTGKTDIYFVSNQKYQYDTADCTFRVCGKVPELWHPDTGVIEKAPVWSQQGDSTTVRLQLEPAGSVFVIFRDSARNADPVVCASSTLEAAAGAPVKLEIQKASYEAIDGTGSLDVTPLLSKLAEKGSINLVINNDNMGKDPTKDHKKQLKVNYTVNGKPASVTLAENQTLILPGENNIGMMPIWQVSTCPKGQPIVKTSENAGFLLTTADGRTLTASAWDIPAPLDISKDWTLKFPANWGAPESIAWPNLISWTEHSDNGIKYFSGTATYEKTINIPASRLQKGEELWLDLGDVMNFAQVTLNGKDLGILWKYPFQVNITDAAKAGSNQLTVKVTNLWPNRLIGDAQLPEDREWSGAALKDWPQWFKEGKESPTGRLTFTTWNHWGKDNTPLTSGMLGPVTLKTVKVAPAR